MATNKKNLKIVDSLDQPLPDSPAPLDAALLHDADPEVGADVAAAEAAASAADIQEPPIGEPVMIAADAIDIEAATAQIEMGAGETAGVSSHPLAAAPLAPAAYDGILTHGNTDAGIITADVTLNLGATNDGAADAGIAGGKAAKHYVVMGPDLNAKLKRIAGSEGVSVSTLVRRALTAFADGQSAAVTGATRVAGIGESLDRVLARAHELESTLARMGLRAVDRDVAHAD
jgi:hypothetical protein